MFLYFYLSMSKLSFEQLYEQQHIFMYNLAHNLGLILHIFDIKSKFPFTASRSPVQCEEDLEKTGGRLHISAAGVKYEKALCVSTNEYKLGDGASAPSPPVPINILQEKSDRTHWTNERPSPVGGRDCEENDSYQKFSFEENSWVMPSPPKPSETLFWEIKNNSSPNTGHYNQKYSFKS